MSTQPLRARRRFLKLAGIALGGAALTCSGVGYAATRTPGVATPDFVFGEEKPMNQRVLVAYATRAGSTVEVAKAIGEALGERGFQVEVKPITANPTVTHYEAVVVGSAIRMGAWLPEAVSFIKNQQTPLSQVPVAFFSVHMLNTDDTEASRQARLAYTAPVRQVLAPRVEAFFAGLIDPARLSFLDRMITTFVQQQTNGPLGDFRDWDKIRGWAKTIFASGTPGTENANAATQSPV